MIKVSRGSFILKLIDRIIGKTLILLLCGFKKIILSFHNRANHENFDDSSIAVCCYGAIGDLLLISESVAILKKSKPKLKVFLFCTSSNKSAAELYSHIYDGFYCVSLTSLNPFSKHFYDKNIAVLIDCNQWANISLIHSLTLKIKNPNVFLKGFLRNSFVQGYDKTVSHSSSFHEFINYHNLISDVNNLKNKDLPYLLPRLFEDNDSPVNNKKILIHMWPSGTRSYLKEWPESYWIKLCEYLMSRGFTLYFSGSPADVVRNESFIKKLNVSQYIDISGKKSLVELAAFISSEIYICISVNTSIMHLAYLSNAAVIGLHGPTNPKRWGPIGSRSIALLPEKGNFAYLNYGFEYPKKDVDAYALHHLTVDQVINAVNLFNK